MPFVQKLPEWNKPGAEPPESLKNAGWAATQKPPADYFNWLQYTAYMALKELQEKAQHKDDAATIPDASITQKGITQLSSAITSTAEDRAATPNAVKKVKDALDSHNNEKASLTAYGHAKLSNATNSEAEDLAATPKAVKEAYDLANQAKQQANDGKTAVANAVTAKGVVASPADTFATLAGKIGQINTGRKSTIINITSSGSSKSFPNAGNSNVTSNYLSFDMTMLDFVPTYIIITQSNKLSYYNTIWYKDNYYVNGGQYANTSYSNNTLRCPYFAGVVDIPVASASVVYTCVAIE